MSLALWIFGIVMFGSFAYFLMGAIFTKIALGNDKLYWWGWSDCARKRNNEKEDGDILFFMIFWPMIVLGLALYGLWICCLYLFYGIFCGPYKLALKALKIKTSEKIVS